MTWTLRWYKELSLTLSMLVNVTALVILKEFPEKEKKKRFVHAVEENAESVYFFMGTFICERT